MKINKFLLTLRLTIIGTCASAQYVTIPDTNFATYLDTIVPTAMNGYQMDTTNTAVLSLTKIQCENRGIKNVFGVQYFKGIYAVVKP